MRKKKVLINSNYSRLYTGFGKNAKNLLKYLYKDGRFELFEYCAGIQWSAPELKFQPWTCRGSLPDDPNTINEINKDPAKARDTNYGAFNIERAVEEFKPDVTMHIEDAWGVTFNTTKSFWGKIPSVLWVTQDSLPLIHEGDANKTPHYWCWSSFATNELHRLGSKNAITQYPLVDLQNFNILSDEQKNKIRERFKIPQDTFIVTQVCRNQLRKLIPNNIEGYSMFKKQNPGVKSILLFVTNFAEGWDIMKLAKQYEVPLNEIWCAYVSHVTGDYVLAPFQGNDLKCPFSGQEKKLHTVNVTKGVTEQALNEIYNITDVISHPATSGACELPLVEAAAAGKIILTPDYSYGEDVIKFNEAAFCMDWAKYTEIHTQFIKSSPFPFGIAKLLKKVYEFPKKRRDELAVLSRKWATENYDENINGKKIADFLYSLPEADWSKIDLKPETKNDAFPMPENIPDNQFVTVLYKEILKMNEGEQGEGHKHWMNSLKQGMTRKAVYDYFISTAKKENEKNKPVDLFSLVDKNTGRKRAVFTLKESIGDCVMSTQLFESFHKEYPDYDFYVCTESKFFDVFAGNPYIYKLIPYHPIFEQEMAMCGAGQSDPLFHKFFHPAIQTQRMLGYLFSDTAAYTKNLNLEQK